ncbi:hypothetical protein M758_UG281700 [Ceratodon purpureus]|nr:hypothetical protein M758_UG281700 [Ceratodon purpureus]
MTCSNLIFISDKCITFFKRVLLFHDKALCLLCGTLGRTFIQIFLVMHLARNPAQVSSARGKDLSTSCSLETELQCGG